MIPSHVQGTTVIRARGAYSPLGEPEIASPRGARMQTLCLFADVSEP